MLFINATVLMLVSNLNLGNIVVFIVGFGFILGCIYEEKIDKLTKNGIGKWIKIVIIVGCIAIFAIMVFIAMVGNINTTKFNEEVVIVLGAGLHGDEVSLSLVGRLNRCVEYANKNAKALIIVSGGQGYQETIPEALAMERYLIQKGISRSRVIKEDKATSTYENFKFSKRILDKCFNKKYKVTYITSDFHSYRAGEIAKSLGINVTSYTSKTEFYMVPTNYAREVLAVVKMWVIGN